MDVVVAAVPVAKLLVPQANGEAPALVASVPHDSTPAALALTSHVEVFRLETMRLVVEAVEAVIIVVDAYGNCDAATVELEKNTPCVQILVLVALVVVAKLFATVNGFTKLA